MTTLRGITQPSDCSLKRTLPAYWRSLLGQLTPELVAALQNTQRLVLKLEDDAISMAQRIGKYQPDAEIDQIEDEEARKRAHKHTYKPQDEYELLANEIKDLFVGEGFIRYQHKLEKFKAPYVPDVPAALGALAKLKQWYADTLMEPRSKAVPMVNALFTQSQLEESQMYDGRKRSALG